jgi:GNAT superfamily N-acetyltransferase
MSELLIRDARPDEHDGLGELMAAVFGSLAGFPGPKEQPRYYELLANVGVFATRPDTKVIVAILDDRVVGGVVYFSDVANYGSGGDGVADREANTSAFRLLAVDLAARGRGAGVALVERCLELARQAGRRQVVIHSSAVMKTARSMYDKLGFVRAPDLDFMQDTFAVLGFRRAL